MLLGLHTDQKGGDVDDLLSNADVSLADENTGVVDRLGKSVLEDNGLQTSLQKVLNLEGKDEIELVLLLGENSVAVESSQESGSIEKSVPLVSTI